MHIFAQTDRACLRRDLHGQRAACERDDEFLTPPNAGGAWHYVTPSGVRCLGWVRSLPKIPSGPFRPPK